MTADEEYLTAAQYLTAAGWSYCCAKCNCWACSYLDETVTLRAALAIQRGRDAAVVAERERCIAIVRELIDSPSLRLLALLADDVERRIREGK